MKAELNDFYNCNYTPSEYCSDFELAVKQWANSTVTLKRSPSIVGHLSETTTFSEWDKNAFPFEYQHFASKFKDKQFLIIDFNEAVQNLNFDGYFSVLVNVRKFKNP